MTTGRDRIRFLKGGLLVIGILILGGVWVMFSRNSQQPRPDRSGSISENINATIAMKGVHHTDIQGGVKDWELDADSVDYRYEENRAYLSKLRATFIDNDGESVFLSAESGTWMTDSNDLEVSGNVMLKNSQCEMKTDKLIFNKKERIFLTDSPVAIRAFSLYKKGDSMTYSLDTGIITTDGNAEVKF